jgi:hypothetical protein
MQTLVTLISKVKPRNVLGQIEDAFFVMKQHKQQWHYFLHKPKNTTNINAVIHIKIKFYILVLMLEF